MPKQLIPALIAGLISASLFVFIMSLGLGFLFMFLPTLPIFWIGFTQGTKATHLTLLIAAIGLALAQNPAAAALFLILFGIPSLMIIRQSVRYFNLGTLRLWAPIGPITGQIALYGCMLLCVISAYYAREPGGLPQMLSDNIRTAFAQLQNQYGEVIELMAGAWAFLILPITLWLWTFMLYAHAWFMHRMAMRRKKAIRPLFSIDPFVIENWMLWLLAIAALASLIGSPQMSFLGKSCFITLLIPYFFLGNAVLGMMLRSMPSGRFILFFIYFFVFGLFWPALIIAGIGVFQQIKHLSGLKTSSKS